MVDTTAERTSFTHADRLSGRPAGSAAQTERMRSQRSGAAAATWGSARRAARSCSGVLGGAWPLSRK